MTINVRDNNKLIIHQHKTAPRLLALADGLLAAIQDDLIEPLAALENTQNLERAGRAGLDDIGERLAIARTQQVPANIEFFGFDMGGTGFDQEPFFSNTIGNLLVVDEEDTAFRDTLRARGKTLVSGTSLVEFIAALEASETQYESIIDNGNGAFTITVTRQTEKNRIQDLIDRNALPIPAGIGITVNVSVTTDDHVYWGTTTTPNDLSGFAAGATTADYNHDLQQLAVPTFNGNARLVFAQRSSDAQVASISIGGFDQTAAFIHTARALQIGGIDYDVWMTRNDIIGSKVAGAVVEFRR